MLNQSSWFIRISSAHMHVDLIRNLMIHFTLRQIISDLVQSCHQITLSHFKTYRINCHFYESFHFMTIHSTCVVFLVVTAAHTRPNCSDAVYTSLQLSRAFANINFYCSFNAKPQLLMGCLWSNKVYKMLDFRDIKWKNGL